MMILLLLLLLLIIIIIIHVIIIILFISLFVLLLIIISDRPWSGPRVHYYHATTDYRAGSSTHITLVYYYELSVYCSNVLL